MNWDIHRKQLLNNPELKKALAENELEYQVARAIIGARINKGLTQKQLADRLNTKQSVISRVENAKTTVSLSFLKRIASVLDTSLEVQFR